MSRMCQTSHLARGTALAASIAIALMAPGCAFAIKHPAVTAGIAAGTLGFATCKLASDDYEACGYVAGGAGAFLGLVTASALWLFGDGDAEAVDEPLPPLLEETPPDSPAPATDEKSPASTSPPSTSPPPTSAPSTSPPPTSPPPTSPPSTSPPPTSPPSTSLP